LPAPRKPFAATPAELRLTFVVVLEPMSRRNRSVCRAPSESSAARFVAAVGNTTRSPSSEIVGEKAARSAGAPAAVVARLTSTVVLVCMSRR
jgi:hypothetical protein